MDLGRARETFEASRDFTVGLEEEFALVDPDSLELVHRFEELRDACAADELLAESVAGELIDTEIEIRSGKGETFGDAVERQLEHRRRLFAQADRLGIGLAAMGTHPWANYLDQRIIDTEHYQRLREELRWVAQRNNTWSLHVHMGVRGADRAIAVCDHLRGLLPPLLALSANSPFLDGHDTGLASVRSEIFTRTFPRCGVPEPFGDWAGYDGLRRSAGDDRARDRVDAALVERPAPSRLRDRRGADLRRPDPRRRGVRPRRDDLRLRRPVGARLRRRPAAGAAAPARDRGEPLAGDPPRARRDPDRLSRPRGDRDQGGDRAPDRVDHAGARGARRSPSTCRGRTAPSEPAARSSREPRWPRSTASRSPRPPTAIRPPERVASSR